MSDMSDTFDLFIAIGVSRQSGVYPVTIVPPGANEIRGQLRVEPVPEPGPTAMPRPHLEIDPEVRRVASEADVTAGILGQPARLLVEVAPPELFAVDWETALPPALGLSPGRFEVVRWSPRRDPRASVPLQLPIDVLLASAGDLSQRASRLANVLRYFRLTLAEGITDRYLHALLRSRAADVLHLHGTGHWGEGGRGVFGEGAHRLELPRLASVLKRSGTRLLVLSTDQQSRAPLLDLAHRTVAGGGPPVLLAAGDDVDQALLNVYFDLVHDHPLHIAAASARAAGGAEVSLVHGRGGKDLLRISPLLERLKGRARVETERARELRRAVQEWEELEESRAIFGHPRPFASLALPVPKVALDKAVEELEGIAGWDLDYDNESGGMVPLGDGFETVHRSEELLDQVESAAGRVVNTWFSAGATAIPTDATLAGSAEYLFNLQIGPPLIHSQVRRPLAIPEEELARFYSDEGLELQVILTSEDFAIPEKVQTLLLPRPPMASRTVRFAVRTPAAPGRARLRAGVYFRQNLLQSLVVEAEVTPEPQRHAAGNGAKVDFALSGSLRDVQRLPERTLNILTNETEDGKHTFVVVGTDLRWSFILKEGAMRTAVKAARRDLLEVAATGGEGGKPGTYRFGDDNRGKPQDFAAAVRKLAYLGYNLYVGQVTRTEAERTALRQALGPCGTIQVAVSDSAEYVFPWALVYDKPLLRDHERNVVCPAFLDALRQGQAAAQPGFLERHICLTGVCPHAADTNVICPSGFWGFRHVIEQPLSVTDREGRVRRDVRLDIKAPGGIRLLMAVSRKLRSLATHRGAVESLPGLTVDFKEAKIEIGKALGRTDLQVAYFFCHGGRKDETVWLGVGNGEKIYSSDLATWQIDWSSARTLVFFNGCHTADVTPDDLLHFNRILAASSASGVIGTEIFIPEQLAAHFALGFLQGLSRGQQIGQVIRQQRLLLLERYNPLGLVYTPYCHAGLKIVV